MGKLYQPKYIRIDKDILAKLLLKETAYHVDDYNNILFKYIYKFNDKEFIIIILDNNIEYVTDRRDKANLYFRYLIKQLNK
jgi:hypothetical protein